MPNISSAQTANASLPTQTLTILGGSGNPGAIAANVEYYNPAKSLWQQAYLADYTAQGHPVTHPWGNVPGTTRWINYRTDGGSDPDASGSNPKSYLYRVRFTVPSDAIDPRMTFSLKADNYAQVAINGVNAGGLITGSANQLNVDAVFSQSVHPGENTITLNITDTGGLNGFNFRIDITMQSSQPLDIVPAQLPVNWVNWTNTETVNGITRYVGRITVPRVSGGVTTIIVKYTPPTQQYGMNWSGMGYWPGICFPQFSNGTDYFAQVSSGVKLRNPPRSPYTSAKVPNIPDGGGAASDKGDIIAVQFGGTNQLDFSDASTGQPISIASPVFAYVSLNGNGYGFDKDFDILSFGDNVTRDMGFWGAGTSYKNTVPVNGVPQYQLLGTGEPHGTLQFRGSFSTVKWQSLSNEVWNGFTIGVAQVAADVPIANAGPDQTVTASSSTGASVQLAGSVSGSTNAPYTYSWTGAFGAASGQNPTVTLPVGTNTITLKVTDAAGSADTDTVVVTVLPAPVDSTPPVIAAPGDIVAEATSPAGATVSFSATATDDKDGNVPVVAAPASGSTFPLGITAVGLAASDAAGNTATAEFDITVRDTTAPVIAPSASITAEASSAAGAVVSYGLPGATDAVSSVTVSGSPASGSVFPLGTSSVNITASDTAGNASTSSLAITVVDTTAPVISAPADILAEATGADGAAVSYSASANDLVDGSVAVTGTPASGSTFPLGTTSVSLSAADSRGNASSASFSVAVRDTTAPALTVPASQTIEAAGAAGAVATFAASATDAVGVTSLTYSHGSGSTFPLGTTTVTVTASDAANNTSTASLSITVVDTTAPAISAPADIVAEATSAAGAAVSYSASATDLVDGTVAVTGTPASGSVFPLGTTSVSLSAADSRSNAASASFSVVVRDTTAPALTVPASQTIEATSADGAVATFAASAADAVGVTSLNYSHGSGSTFPLGATTVTVTASDAAGNTSSGSFTITVVDTTAPALAVPANQTLEATSAAGAVATFAASATDAVGVTSLTSSPASGSTFALGTTTVAVSASDAAGNTSSGSFTVTVQDTTAPAITAVTPSIRTIWPPNKKMIPVSVSVSASDAVGIASAKIISVATNQPDRRTQWQITGPLAVSLLADRHGDKQDRIYTITIEVRDAAGNVSTATTTVIVPHDQRDEDDRDDDHHNDDGDDDHGKKQEKKEKEKGKRG